MCKYIPPLNLKNRTVRTWSSQPTASFFYVPFEDTATPFSLFYLSLSDIPNPVNTSDANSVI